MANYLEIPMEQWTIEQLSEFTDSHLIMALRAADLMQAGMRFASEDYLRDRLVALSDSWDTPETLAAEDKRRRSQRLLRVITEPISDEPEGD